MKIPNLTKSAKLGILIAILLLGIVRSWYGTRLDSFANDEPFHIISAAYYVAEGDYRLNPEHPPLSKDWVGLFNQHLELRPMEVLNDKDHEREWLQEIMYFDNDARLSQKRSRLAMYSFHFILGLGIALLLWRIFGFGWAVVSLLWLALEPSIGAHQPVVLTDLPLSFTLILAALTGGMFCYSWKWKWAIAFGVTLGMAFAVKHSALPGLAMMIGVSALVAIYPILQKNWSNAGRRVLKWAAACLIMLATLWAAYGFNSHSSEGGQDLFNRSLELKISDLNTERWRVLLTFMDKSQLLPKAYIWGLADTIRAGIEGRGDDQHLFFGTIVYGRAPLLYFPGVILSKIPIALLLLYFIGISAILIAFARPHSEKIRAIDRKQWFVIIALVLVMVAHTLALMSGRTSYGGIRHALPIVAIMGILSGGAILWQFPRNHALKYIIPGALLLTCFVTTIGEQRIWEYYNEIVGGTENAYKCFCDEGNYLGQRFYETEEFFSDPEVDSSEPVHAWAWYMEEEKDASSLNFRDGVQDINDTASFANVDGYFLIDMCDYNKTPEWDPEKIEGLVQKKRIGHIMIAHGELRDTTAWAISMSFKVLEYITESKGNTDWELVAKRMEKVTEYTQQRSNPFLILGNAYVMTGERNKAIAAYQKSADNIYGEDPNKVAILEQIEKIKNAEDMASVGMLRPYFME
ncbi:ArnT family glycosyltransferase [Fulvivirga sedimenti]|uniref:Phospholipid carrier-dependent glycosyltransferase n=1 Tax=Fulvivirga sedimenti TaxID=2879465 RepID=A0A9X1HXV2_9BACT|nr:phospholipid carrier-dependent glycosyltransferase [Fulvivirga sedimenti]MCA6079028.1 phospholipid carrier-dependent glycosyltransferase [Fulvivirga sedimenti]